MIQKLSEICDFYTGNGFPMKYQGNNDGELPFYKVSDIADNVNKGNIFLDFCRNYISRSEAKEIKGQIIPKNTIIFAKIGEAVKLNRRAITNQDCLIDNNCMGIKPNKFLDLKYFYYFMKNIKMERFAEATTVPSVKRSKLENLKFDFPVKEEQIKISLQIDKIYSVMFLQKKQLQYLDDLVKARFVEMFGDPVNNPMKWKVSKLGNLCSKISSGNTPKGGSKVYVNEGIMFFRSQNVWKNRLELDDIAYIDKKTHESMKDTALKYGDILITKTGRINTENSSLGRSALYLGKDNVANINGHVYLVRLNSSDVNRYFVLQILISSEFRDLIRRVCVGGIDKRQLNRNHIEDFSIILPPIELQNQFADFVKEVDKSKFEIQKSLEKTQQLYDSLMQKYFG